MEEKNLYIISNQIDKKIPDFLVKKIEEEYSKEDAEYILKGLKEDKKTTFRVNKIKSSVKEIEIVLKENNIQFARQEGFEDAFILEKSSEQLVRNLEIYKEGKIYLQSLSSMIPVHVLVPKEKENILDMCAAPRW